VIDTGAGGNSSVVGKQRSDQTFSVNGKAMLHVAPKLVQFMLMMTVLAGRLCKNVEKYGGHVQLWLGGACRSQLLTPHSRPKMY
jgi:hypothetical protein